MKNYIKTMTANEIRNSGIKATDSLGYDYQYEHSVDNYYLTVNGVRTIRFTNNKDLTKSYNKIKSMGRGLAWTKPQLTDEEQGIIQAAENGENPFAFSVICSNPKLNGIFK
jgi:hypothetical protein